MATKLIGLSILTFFFSAVYSFLLALPAYAAYKCLAPALSIPMLSFDQVWSAIVLLFIVMVPLRGSLTVKDA